jgi:hypothetical protein
MIIIFTSIFLDDSDSGSEHSLGVKSDELVDESELYNTLNITDKFDTHVKTAKTDYSEKAPTSPHEPSSALTDVLVPAPSSPLPPSSSPPPPPSNVRRNNVEYSTPLSSFLRLPKINSEEEDYSKKYYYSTVPSHPLPPLSSDDAELSPSKSHKAHISKSNYLRCPIPPYLAHSIIFL